mmetsp:Transcript_3807/g.7485  ORF Transcript_3807/g.7485 Transcript_3807/m.7485 type:complete len:109 (+) Transcript_3807:212-538(+)
MGSTSAATAADVKERSIVHGLQRPLQTLGVPSLYPGAVYKSNEIKCEISIGVGPYPASSRNTTFVSCFLSFPCAGECSGVALRQRTTTYKWNKNKNKNRNTRPFLFNL